MQKAKTQKMKKYKKKKKNTQKRVKITNRAKIGKNATFIFYCTFFILHVFLAGLKVPLSQVREGGTVAPETKLSVTQSFFKIQTPDFALKF